MILARKKPSSGLKGIIKNLQTEQLFDIIGKLNLSFYTPWNPELLSLFQTVTDRITDCNHSKIQTIGKY